MSNCYRNYLLWRPDSYRETQKIQRTAGGLVFENTNSFAPEKTSTCQAVHNSIKFHFDTNF